MNDAHRWFFLKNLYAIIKGPNKNNQTLKSSIQTKDGDQKDAPLGRANIKKYFENYVLIINVNITKLSEDQYCKRVQYNWLTIYPKQISTNQEEAPNLLCYCKRSINKLCPDWCDCKSGFFQILHTHVHLQFLIDFD